VFYTKKVFGVLRDDEMMNMYGSKHREVSLCQYNYECVND